MTKGDRVNRDLGSWLLVVATVEVCKLRTEINKGKSINTTAVKRIKGRFLREQSDLLVKLNALFKAVQGTDNDLNFRITVQCVAKLDLDEWVHLCEFLSDHFTSLKKDVLYQSD